MTEKTFTINAENTPNTYTLTVKCSGERLELKVKNNSDPAETYESTNLTLPELQKKNKTYKQFDSLSKIVDVISKKVESKNFIFRTNQSVLNIKNTNEYDEVEYIPFEIASTAKPTGPSENSAELVRLKEENERLKRENLDLQKQLQNCGVKPKPTSQPVQKGEKKDCMPVLNKPKNENEKFWQPLIYDDPYKKIQNDTSTAKENVYTMVCPFGLGNRATYINDKPIFEKLNILMEKKKNLKNTVADIQKRFDEYKKNYDKAANKLFAGNPSEDDKNVCLENIKNFLLLYQELRDIDHYDDLIKLEVANKNLTFTGADKEKYDEGLIVLGKRIPFEVAQQIQKLNHAMRELIKNFYTDKNIKFYKADSIKDITDFKDKLLWSSN